MNGDETTTLETLTAARNPRRLFASIGAAGWVLAATFVAARALPPRSPETSGGVVLSENFDEMTAPALPYGWVATNAQGPDPLWVTDGGDSDTPPNAAHIDDPNAVSDKRLDSPPIPITTSSAQLTFRQSVDLYAFLEGGLPGEEDCLPLIPYDGGVLEISIGGGDFEDILTAGGAFLHGGYECTLVSSPLAGRLAWVGGSGTGSPPPYLTTTVTLPPTAAGNTVVLRWRMGSSGQQVEGIWTGWWIDSITLCDGYVCGAVPMPAGVNVDTSGNGVWEPGETVDVAPLYINDGNVALNLWGTATSLTGPEGATYTITDSNAYYGSILPGFLGGCQFTPDCYAVSVNDPTPRPLQHWDVQLSESLSTGAAVARALHIGGSFTDVPSWNNFYRNIETVFHDGITGGCGSGDYCPDASTLRKQMAVFLLKSKFESAYVPPAAVGIFADVPATDPFAPWIEDLYNRGITGGCSSAPLEYCPDQPVLRQQMAVFLLKTLLGSSYAPPACTGLFTDVSCPSLFADWIEDLYHRQIAAGCGGGNFCPTNPTTRGEMASFVVNTFGLSLYGP